MKSLIGNILFVAIVLLIVTRFLSIWAGTSFPLSLITSNSMSPALMEGDVVACIPVDIEDVRVGDVIVFKSWLSWPEEKVVVHRVVGIKRVWGKPAFITKGDANRWTDQSGPHIPEPYVTEKNFIGKTVSIGKQPLKIPLVGYLGIWINEGFRRIAQPAASKGTTTYVGVFTPLIISVILFVVSLFVVPEKTRTLSEKIRFYIFGSRSFDVKRVFAMFLVMYVVLLVFIHVFAYDSVSASIGVGEFPEKGYYQLGTIAPGKTGFPKRLPVVNPGVMPVRGIVFGKKDMSQFIHRTMFEVESGGYAEVPLIVTAGNDTKNGTYIGDVMVYSSPFWLLFPDELVTNLLSLWDDGYIAVVCLDVLSACVLSGITMSAIIAASFLTKRYGFWMTDLSWCYAPKIYLKKGVLYYIKSFRQGIRRIVGRHLAWIAHVDLADIDFRKPILASLVVVPLFLFMSSEMLAMITSSVLSALIAFFISCKLREKIVLTTFLTMLVSILYLMMKTNYYLFSSNRFIVESIALGMGAVATYLLLLGLLLVPISLFSWYITHLLRNLKEQRDPLLMLEGRCNL